MSEEQSQLKKRLIQTDFELDQSKVNERLINNTPLLVDNHSLYQKPLDLYMVCTGQDDLDGQLEPLNVYTQTIQPKTHYQSNGQAYYTYFDETSYRNQGLLRNINEKDGLIGYYSSKKQENILQMLVCVTMYSEERNFLEQTLLHIQNNLKGFQELEVQDFQVVVAVIYDGIMKAKEEVVDFYLEIDSENGFDLDKNLKRRREIIQSQMDYLTFTNQSHLLDTNEGLPPTIPKQISLLYQNRFQLSLQDKSNRNSKVQIICPQNPLFDTNHPSLTVFSLFKHKNAKKLSSHLWFFEGLCRQTRPKYVCFVDAGTLPSQYGIVKFYQAMEGNQTIGGVCGFLGLEEPPEGGGGGGGGESKSDNDKLEKLKKNLQQLKQQDQIQWEQQYQQEKQDKQKELRQVKIYTMSEINQIFDQLSSNFRNQKLAQVQEYAIGHIIDKNFDSFLGFMHVLPGAWSAYRYDALEVRKGEKSNFMQDSYFKSVLNPELLTDDIKEANKFLAEDRILCLGIISAKGSNYKLKYIPEALAVTDSPETLEEFIHQHRRWTNSMIFALNHVLKNYKASIQGSKHSNFYRKICLPVNMLFAYLGLINYIVLPAFFLFMVILSGYQFYIPSNIHGVAFINEDLAQNKCQIDYQLKEFDLQQLSKIRIFNMLMKTFPFAIVVTVVVFMIVCLSFKMKKQNLSEYLKLFNQVLTQEDKQKIQSQKQQLIEKQKTPEQIETCSNNLIFKLGEKRLKDLKIIFDQNQSHKLPKDLQKIKSEYDRIYSQKYYNKVYKIFASLFSIEASILMIILSAALYINIFTPDTFSDLGFFTLPKWMRDYIIIILIFNMGLILLILFFHTIFQPKILWLFVKSYFSYILYSPVYQIYLTIFSFCNLDDVTWGTKGLQNSTQNQTFLTDKVRYVKYWVFLNSSLIIAFLCASLIPLDKTPYVIIGIGIYGSLYNSVRIIGGSINYIKYFVFDKIKIKSAFKKIISDNIQKQDEIRYDYQQILNNCKNIEFKIQELSESEISDDNIQLITSRMISQQYSNQSDYQLNMNKEQS
ncbi:chitin synthase (macronuclear) [Tetrahymena thermophila SB210]|uniref:chitin synthase n=1 Tax=Tetrahymena thermophila (strain SB210) TaxID=312017 RepID=Q22Z67_TETTS|nr:chitin synthase [Tetrahymena thermophila SB210]EAR90454.2 chitin synthase [Tetrahymena thermophila SB210]|eukprot:XP_001010699.2 chitin synthase [Tetrahymena thermophila SB210]